MEKKIYLLYCMRVTVLDSTKYVERLLDLFIVASEWIPCLNFNNLRLSDMANEVSKRDLGAPPPASKMNSSYVPT